MSVPSRVRTHLPVVAVLGAVGLLASVATTDTLKRMEINDVVAVLAGIVVASVWNFALSSKFVWGKY